MSDLISRQAAIDADTLKNRWKKIRTGRARMIEAIKTVLAVIGGLTVASAVALAIIIFKR